MVGEGASQVMKGVVEVVDGMRGSVVEEEGRIESGSK